jgi:hypothetical protein
LELVWREFDLGFKRYEFWKLELFSENQKAFLVNWVVFFALLGRWWVARLVQQRFSVHA